MLSLILESEIYASFLERFTLSEEGAVTVDWVVLSAAIVGTVVAVVAILQPSFSPLPETISDSLEIHYQNVFGTGD